MAERGGEGPHRPLGLIGNVRVPLGIVNRRCDTLQQSYHLESIILMFTLVTFFQIQKTLPISNVLDLELTPWLINFTKFSLYGVQSREAEWPSLHQNSIKSGRDHLVCWASAPDWWIVRIPAKLFRFLLMDFWLNLFYMIIISFWYFNCCGQFRNLSPYPNHEW